MEMNDFVEKEDILDSNKRILNKTAILFCSTSLFPILLVFGVLIQYNVAFIYVIIELILCIIIAGLCFLMAYHIFYTERIRNIRFSISHSKIKYVVDNNEYLKINWSTINKIEVKRELYWRGNLFSRNYLGYKLKFTGPQYSDIFRLWLTSFNKKNTRLIIETLKRFCEIKEKEFIEKKEINKIDRLESTTLIKSFNKN